MRLLTPFIQRPDAGALPTLRAATDPGVCGGQYYGPSGLGEARGHPVLVNSCPDSHDAEVQARLWTVSEELTGCASRRWSTGTEIGDDCFVPPSGGADPAKRLRLARGPSRSIVIMNGVPRQEVET